MRPSVGRIVHFAASVGDEWRAAIVTRVEEDDIGDTLVDLTVFPPGAPPFLATQVSPAHWRWPPREG